MSATLALRRGAAGARGLGPGIALAAALAVVAGWVAGGLGEPLARNPVLVAMLLGLLLGNAFACPMPSSPASTSPSATCSGSASCWWAFASRCICSASSASRRSRSPRSSWSRCSSCCAGSRVRVFKLDPELALLVAAGSAICGAAAILCVAAVTRAREQHAGIAIALITLAGTLALLVYPVAFAAGFLPGLDDRQFGTFVGASIYELAQVYGASFAVSEGALNTATLVKLSKVLMLIPMLLVLGGLRRRRDRATASSTPIPFPWFVLGFVAVMLLNSSFTLHPQARRLILEFDQFLFLMVMIALGLTTRLSRLKEGGVGWRLLGVGAVGLALSSAVAYGLVASTSARGATTETPAAESAMRASTGGRLFSSSGCDKCHVPSLRAKDGGSVTLFSDLLIHDMGPALDDKIVQSDATGADWRTTPLVALHTRRRYLHDGRATTLRDAVLAHGGEAQVVRDRFFRLDDAEQDAVYRYLAGL